MGNVEIIICKNKYIELKNTLLEKFNHIILVDNYSQLKEKISTHNGLNARVVFINIDELISKNGHIYKKMRVDLMYKGASLIACEDNISNDIKMKLYTFGFKAIIERSTQNKLEIIEHVIKRSNLYASTFANNFMRAFLECQNDENNL